jgi:F0F1-type ATP synthase epsilon subunit
MHLTRKLFAAAFLVSLFATSAIPVQARDRDDHRCEQRIRQAEQKLRQAERKHGERSRQAEQRRRQLEEAREHCRHDRR